MTKRKPKTAGELIAELEKDPEFLDRRRKQEEALRLVVDEWARAEAPLVRELRDAGAQVSSVWDLVNTPGSYAKLVPILLAHLERPYPERVREGIARALAVPEARQGWDQLVSAYLADPDTAGQGVKWAVHLAIARGADASVLDTLICLATDRRHGYNRLMFVDALDRIGGPRAEAALAELAGDPDLADSMRQLQKKRQRRKKKP
jgi:hypothetical protein